MPRVAAVAAIFVGTSRAGRCPPSRLTLTMVSATPPPDIPGPSQRFSDHDATSPKGMEMTTIQRPRPATSSISLKLPATSAMPPHEKRCPKSYEDSKQESSRQERSLASRCERGTKFRSEGGHRRIVGVKRVELRPLRLACPRRMGRRPQLAVRRMQSVLQICR